MIAAVTDRAQRPAVAWREVRCADKACRTLLLRYRVPAGAGRPLGSARRVVVELVCPDRRCRRAQTVVLPDGDTVIQ